MKAFGIVALILSIIGIFIPVIGYFIAGLSGFLAIFSAGKGTTLGLSAVILNIININLFSPSLLLMASDNHSLNPEHQEASITIFTVLMLIQVVAIGLFIAKKVMMNRAAIREKYEEMEDYKIRSIEK